MLDEDIQGFEDVLSHKSFGSSRVLLLQRVHDPLVVAQAEELVLGRVPVVRAIDQRQSGDAAQNVAERGAAGRLDDDPVKRQVFLDERHDIVEAGELSEANTALAQEFQLLVADEASSSACGV